MLTEKSRHILNESLQGYDFDTTMVRLGLMNLMMHGIDEPHVDYKGTLSKTFNQPNQYDIVMANQKNKSMRILFSCWFVYAIKRN